MEINHLTDLEGVPLLIIIYPLIVVLVSLVSFVAIKFFIEKVKNLRGKISRLFESIFLFINEILKVIMLFSMGICLLGCIMFLVILVFVFAMNTLYEVSKKNVNLGCNIFSTLASPLATTLSISFTILIAVLGNKLLNLREVKDWVKDMIKIIESIIENFMGLNGYMAMTIISFLFSFEIKIIFSISLRTSVNLGIVILIICWLVLFLIGRQEKREKKKKIKQLEKLLNFIITSRMLPYSCSKRIKGKNN